MFSFLKLGACLHQTIDDDSDSISQDQLVINNVPDEILLNIFRNFSAEELNNVSLVDKRWNFLANDNLLWKALFENIFEPEQGSDDFNWKSHYKDQCKKIGPIIKYNDFKIAKQHYHEEKDSLAYIYFDEKNNVKGIDKK